MERQGNFSDRVRRCFPIIEWLPSYKKQWLSSDLIAGTTLAAFTIPEAIAYSDLAGMPPQAGLYACIAAPILYTLFGTSRQLAVGPTSAVSVLVASALGALTVNSPAQYAALAAMTAILVGLIAFVAYLLRLGVLMKFISESVLVGFSSGAALYIASTQLGKLFGIHGAQGEFIERISHLIRHMGETNPWALGLGLVALVILVTGEHLVRRVPWSLIIVLGSIGLMHIVDPHALGISVAGAIPSGFPAVSLPLNALPDVRQILPGAFAIFVLAYVEGMSMARTFASKHGYRADPNQELLALGCASIGAGFTQSYPVAGSFSRSALNDQVGARTQLASGFSALLIVLVVLYLTGIFSKLPEFILAVVVLVAVKGLFKWKQLIKLFELSPPEFSTALSAFAGVLVFGILDGVVIGALLSLLIFIWRASQSNVSVLGKVPGQPQFSSMQENPENIPVPGMIIVRVDAGLFYANAESIKDTIMELVRQSDKPVQAAVLDIATSATLDLAAAEMLAELHQDLKRMGVSLRLSGVRRSAGNMLDRMGITAEIGEGHFHRTPLLAVAEYLAQEGSDQQMSSNILPDVVGYLLKMVSGSGGLLKGEEQERLEAIRSKLEQILDEFKAMPREEG